MRHFSRITLFHFNKINYWNEIILLEITVTVALKLREGERGTCDKTGLTDILPHYFQTVERLEQETAAGYNVGKQNKKNSAHKNILPQYAQYNIPLKLIV